MSKPLISIIVPVFNASLYLPKCVDSILAQSFTAWELILIDDGSTDNSLEICQHFKERDFRVKVYLQSNHGPSSARNIGIQYANGDYIAFIDADDWIEPTMLEQMYFSIKDADLCICGYFRDFVQVAPHHIKSTQVTTPSQHINTITEFEAVLNTLYLKSYMNSLWNKLYKRSIIWDNKIRFDNNIFLGEDLLFNLRYLCFCKKTEIISDCLYHYITQPSDSLTQKFVLSRPQNTKLLFDAMQQFALNVFSDDSVLQTSAHNDLYLRSCFQDIEQIYHKDCPLTRRQKNTYVHNIVYSSYTQCALDAIGCKKKEFTFYRILLKSKNIFLIKTFAYLRLKIKRIVRYYL